MRLNVDITKKVGKTNPIILQPHTELTPFVNVCVSICVFVYDCYDCSIVENTHSKGRVKKSTQFSVYSNGMYLCLNCSK